MRFFPIFMGFESFHRRNPLSYKTLHGHLGTILRSIADHHVLPELTFKDKTPQPMEHVGPQNQKQKYLVERLVTER